MSTETVFYELVPVKAAKAKKQRQQQEHSYKSIIRTRAQKQREEIQYVEKMLTNINNYYEMYKSEPRVDDPVLEVAAMGNFLKNLRTVFNANVMDDWGVEKVMHYLPWFSFETPAVKKSRTFVSLGFLLFICFTVPAVFMAAQYVTHFCYKENKCAALMDETYNSAAHFTRVTGQQMHNGYMQLQRVSAEFISSL